MLCVLLIIALLRHYRDNIYRPHSPLQPRVTSRWRLGLTQYLASSLGALVVNIGTTQVT